MTMTTPTTCPHGPIDRRGVMRLFSEDKGTAVCDVRVGVVADLFAFLQPPYHVKFATYEHRTRTGAYVVASRGCSMQDLALRSVRSNDHFPCLHGHVLIATTATREHPGHLSVEDGLRRFEFFDMSAPTDDDVAYLVRNLSHDPMIRPFSSNLVFNKSVVCKRYRDEPTMVCHSCERLEVRSRASRVFYEEREFSSIAVAYFNTHADCIYALARAGQDVDEEFSNLWDMADVAFLLVDEYSSEQRLAYHRIPSPRPLPKTTALMHYFIEKNRNATLLDALLHSGANPNVEFLQVITPLAATVAARPEEHAWVVSTVNILVSAGANVDAVCGKNTALTLVIQKRRYRLVTTLIDAGADPNVGYNEETPLVICLHQTHCYEPHCTADANVFECISTLVNAGACLYTGEVTYRIGRKGFFFSSSHHDKLTARNYPRDGRHDIMLRARRVQAAYLHARMLTCIARQAQDESDGGSGGGGGEAVGNALICVLSDCKLVSHIVSYTSVSVSPLACETVVRIALNTGMGPRNKREMTAVRKAVMQAVSS